MTMLDVDTVLQNALNRVTDTLTVSDARRRSLRDAIEQVAYKVTQDKEGSQDITNGIMRGLFGIGPEAPQESESDLKARIDALEEKIKQLTQPLAEKQPTKEAVPPFAPGAIVESKQGTLKGLFVVIRAYLGEDDGHALWFVDLARLSDGVRNTQVYAELLQLVE
jgi:hypothetical protein